MRCLGKGRLRLTADRPFLATLSRVSQDGAASMEEPSFLSHAKEADRMRGHNNAPLAIEDLTPTAHLRPCRLQNGFSNWMAAYDVTVR
jgi:hypothetical protein